MIRFLNLNEPIVMGILNITPDSFYCGKKYLELSNAIEHGIQMASEGAAIIDVGGESTRPYAKPVTTDEELARVIPVIKNLSKELKIPISIDTSNPEVMRAAIDHGASLINDVRSLSMPGAMQAVCDLKVPVCLMHMQGSPENMQNNPNYLNVVDTVYNYLQTKAEVCIQHGIKADNIIIDPGFGFGKKLEHNLQLLSSLNVFKKLAYPILVGISRKSMIGEILGLPVDQRLYGSIAAATIAAIAGANIIRTHDVKATVEALKIANAVLKIK